MNMGVQCAPLKLPASASTSSAVLALSVDECEKNLIRHSLALLSLEAFMVVQLSSCQLVA